MARRRKTKRRQKCKHEAAEGFFALILMTLVVAWALHTANKSRNSSVSSPALKPAELNR